MNRTNLALLACLAGCVPELEAPEPQSEPEVSDRIDASDPVEWVYRDLDAAVTVTADDPTWDLGFRRFEVITNGGVSGDGPVEAAVIEGADFDGLTTAPTDGWQVDTDDDGDGTAELVFVDWYVYDYTTHLLSPAERFYVVHTTEDTYLKLRFDEYYDDAGTPAQLALSLEPIAAPGGGR